MSPSKVERMRNAHRRPTAAKKVLELLDELRDVTPGNEMTSPPVDEVRESFKPPAKGPCGKTVYTSESQAKREARRLLSNKRANTSRLRTYWCETCRSYHLTSSFWK